MKPRDLVASLLGGDAPDAGCDGGMEVLDRYVEAELDGLDAAALFPDVAVHLESCADCSEDHEGLLELARRPPDAG